MRITVTARHFELTDDIREYIAKKLEKVETFYDRIREANAILTLEKHRYIVELDAFAKRTTLHSEVEMHDLQAAIDSALEKINKQSQKFKERVKHKKKRASMAEVAETLALASSISELKETSSGFEEVVEEASGTAEPESESLQIIRENKCAPKPMIPEEAAMQLKLSKNIFLVFLNAQSNQLNVVYKKRNGGFGWIEPI
jgi:putative sigma-54 modulation protein